MDKSRYHRIHQDILDRHEFEWIHKDMYEYIHGYVGCLSVNHGFEVEYFEWTITRIFTKICIFDIHGYVGWSG